MNQIMHSISSAYRPAAWLCISLVLAMLTGCFGSSPNVRYYVLSTEPAPANDKETSLGVGPFELPEYLNRSQVVTRNEGNRLIINEFDRWGENLEMSISRRITADIAASNDDLLVYEVMRTTSFPGDYRTFGQIMRFEADQSNTVTLEVVWIAAKINNNKISSENQGRRSRYTREVNSSNDLDEVTKAMGLLLDEFSADINAEMNRLLATEQAAD